MEREFDKNQVLNILKNIFELEMSGVVRYTHYSLMIFVSNRLPLVDFFRSNAKESLSHAYSIKESNKHDIYEILKETLDHEKKAISTYYKLLDVVSNKSVYLEEYARSMIQQEELHSQEVEKMIKTN